MPRILKAVSLAVLLCLLSFPLFSQSVIDFENLNLNEGDHIFDQYADGKCGVRFYVGDPANNVHPVLARVGSPRIAFQGPTGTSAPACNTGVTQDDMPDPSANVGCWFLTDDGILNSSASEIRVLYNTPTTQCSGDLIDIDGAEIWTIEAYSGGSLLATQTFTTSNATPGDGMATPWQFNLSSPLDELRFMVTKPGGGGIGIAFDNFSACSIPQEFCCPGENLIENGNFNQGNVGFQSSYSYEPDQSLHSVLQNEYTITSQSGVTMISDCWRASDAATCDDEGRFMAINGNTCDPFSAIVWSTEVGVEPNTIYQFCAFFKNLPNCCFDKLPHVTILISGQNAISQTISTTSDPCDWQLIAHTFNSGNNGSLTISILLDGAPGWDGNDLAIDEISLKPIPQVPNSQVMFNPNSSPDPIDPTTFFNLDATPSFPLDSGCTFSWEVCEWDGSGNCIAGTEVINPPSWQTIPTNFPGYVGTSTLAGSNPGRFDYNRSYRVVYSVTCPCETENSSAWIYDPNPMRTMETSYFMETQLGPDGTMRLVRSNRQMEDGASGQNKTIDNGGQPLGLEIVPNPASNQATISYHLNSNEEVSLQLVNSEGQVVFEIPVDDQLKGSHQQKLQLSELSAGIYLVRMEIGERTLVRKLVVQD